MDISGAAVILPTTWLYHFALPPGKHKSSSSSTPLSALGLSVFVVLAILVGMWRTRPKPLTPPLTPTPTAIYPHLLQYSFIATYQYYIINICLHACVLVKVHPLHEAGCVDSGLINVPWMVRND